MLMREWWAEGLRGREEDGCFLDMGLTSLRVHPSLPLLLSHWSSLRRTAIAHLSQSSLWTGFQEDLPLWCIWLHACLLFPFQSRRQIPLLSAETESMCLDQWKLAPSLEHFIKRVKFWTKTQDKRVLHNLLHSIWCCLRMIFLVTGGGSFEYQLETAPVKL
jgi:hypothetical protein